MPNVSVNQMREILSRVAGATPVGLSALTEVKARKGHPFAEIAKLSRVSAFTGADWESTVNRQLVREGKLPEFIRQPRSWGQRVSAALVSHGTKWYLPTHVQRTARPVYLVRKVAGGPWVVVSKDTVAPWLPESKPANTNTDKALFYRDWSLANLTRLAIGGTVYRIR